MPQAGQNPRHPIGSDRRHWPSSGRVGPSVRTHYSVSGPKSIHDFLARVPGSGGQGDGRGGSF
jgi:hypothetical protein